MALKFYFLREIITSYKTRCVLAHYYDLVLSMCQNWYKLALNLLNHVWFQLYRYVSWQDNEANGMYSLSYKEQEVIQLLDITTSTPLSILGALEDGDLT